MKVIGITGGVGSGKSSVLSYIEETYHAHICQADHVAWELQRPGEICYENIVAEFGKEILNNDKTINRKQLGNIVFSDATQMQVLNQITHPAVKTYIIEEIARKEKDGITLFVLEAALLIEEHYDEICDELWYIYTDELVRRERLKESRGYDDEKIDDMIAAQLSEETFRSHCQRVIDNSGAFLDTCFQIDKAMKYLGEKQ